jgi:hypothetical protein
MHAYAKGTRGLCGSLETAGVRRVFAFNLEPDSTWVCRTVIAAPVLFLLSRYAAGK